MTLAEVLDTLKKAEPTLRPRGVTHAAVFGSVARGEERADSDIDIAIELDTAINRTVWDLAGAKTAVADLFQVPVDVVDRSALRPHLRDAVERELVYAF
jgi:predicted nucleotidyltransferase